MRETRSLLHRPLSPTRHSSSRKSSSNNKGTLSAAQLAGSSRRLLLHRRRRQHQHRNVETSEQALDAAALQDRLMRRMKLDLGGQQPRAVLVLSESGDGGGGRCADRAGVRRRRLGRGSAGGRSDENVDDNASTTADRRSAGASTAWTCQACSAENHSNTSAARNGRSNSGGLDICSVCVQPRQRRRPSSAETGVHVCREGGGDGGPDSREHQQQRKVAVTLAQIRGLEEPPEPTLTPGEWR